MVITYVTITYNAATVLQRTLDSVLRQDYPDIVHIIIDGASTDGTLEMVNDYISQSNEADNGHKVLVTSEPDHGIYDAMNKGLRSIDGDYVCFLNAGDFLPAPDTVSKIVASVSQGDPAVLYGDTDIVDAGGRFLHHRRLSPPEQLTWKSFRHGMLVCHQAFYARADFAIATPYDLRYRYSADVDWCIRIMKAAAKENVPMQNLHMVVANYTEEGQTTLHHRESLIERFKVMGLDHRFVAAHQLGENADVGVLADGNRDLAGCLEPSVVLLDAGKLLLPVVVRLAVAHEDDDRGAEARVTDEERTAAELGIQLLERRAEVGQTAGGGVVPEKVVEGDKSVLGDPLCAGGECQRGNPDLRLGNFSHLFAENRLQLVNGLVDAGDSVAEHAARRVDHINQRKNLLDDNTFCTWHNKKPPEYCLNDISLIIRRISEYP